MKNILLALFLAAAPAFAGAPAVTIADYRLWAGPEALEIHGYRNFGVISVARPQIDQVVRASERVGRGELAPGCAVLEAETASSICYTAETVEILAFDGFLAITLPTAEVRAALRAPGT